MLNKIDKISLIEPSIDATRNEWARFQVQLYLETTKLLENKAQILFAPSLVLSMPKTFRTRPDCLILWGERNHIQGVVAINATIKYHLDDLKDRVIKLDELKKVADCPTHLSELFFSKCYSSDACYDCSQCPRPVFIPVIVTKSPYEGTSYCLIDKSVHLMDFDTYIKLINDFEEIQEQSYPFQFIVNKFKPSKCPFCGRPLTLSTVWTCDYTDDYFAEKCDSVYEWINGGHYNYQECCGVACPSFHRFWCEDLIEREYAFFCLDCEKVFDKQMQELPFCTECSDRFCSI